MKRAALLCLAMMASIAASFGQEGTHEWTLAQAPKPGRYATGAERCGAAPYDYPKLRIGTRAGYCAGLAASRDDGLQFPRSIVQIPGHDLFVVADMGAWGAFKGRLLLFDPAQPAGRRIKVLLERVDYPFGLVIGLDRKVYSSTTETIFRFDPLAATPKDTVETVVQGLPSRNITLPDGTKVAESVHLMKAFVFDKTGRLYVNVGAPTDACVAKGPANKPCAAGEGASPLAAIWAFTPPTGGIFPALKPGDPNPPREIFARGLRNSMALAVHPEFPDAGFAFLQAENARDLEDPLKPNEEINALQRGRHYGWPYCYDLSTASQEFKTLLQASGPYKDFCNNGAAYRAPYSLLPPHGAPLGMLYYQGSRFPELNGKLIVGLHGYRPAGSRVIFYDVDAKGFPVIHPAPVHYNLSCAAEPSRPFQTDREKAVPAAAFTELIGEWHRVNGVRPQGAPVGMTVASDGAIWLVEDKNATIIRIDKDADAKAKPLPCNVRSDLQIDELVGYVTKDKGNRERLTQLRTDLVEKHCSGCHSDFGLKPQQSSEQRDIVALRFVLSQDGWVYPGDPESGRLRARLRGLGREKVMPPDGRELLKDAAYRRLLDTVDNLVATMVPGQRMRVRLGRVERGFRDRSGKLCGAIPSGHVVVVVDKNAQEKPGFSRIYRPADIFLNGECADGDGYYLETRNLDSL
ncbi:glucose/sorbosone dehydrogenase [Rhodoplanes sp. Z2-YC6860]|nr:glucose/sorbosone dehydrogenase [Rhodoplanes sp. Z2-YC6860]